MWPKNKSLVVEIGLGHDGSLFHMLSILDLLREAGVSSIKFQIHDADGESTHDEPFRTQIAPISQDACRFDYWSRTSFDYALWEEIIAHCRSLGFEWIGCSVFCVKAVEELVKRSINFDFWKIGSGEIRSYDLIERCASLGSPIVISCGLGTYKDIENAINYSKSAPWIGLMHCISKYPVELQDIGLQEINNLRSRFGVDVGYSDHSGMISPAICARLRHDAFAVEVHGCIAKTIKGFDTAASLDVEDLNILSRIFDSDLCADNSRSFSRDRYLDEVKNVKTDFGKSLALKSVLKKGDVLHETNLTLKKPGSGIQLHQKDRILGLKAKRDLSTRTILKFEDFE